MKFRLISDVHNEFFTPEHHYGLPEMPDEQNMVLVIAGDFTMFHKANEAANTLTNLGQRFKHVLYVPGNHEYYSTRIDEKKNREQFALMNPKGLKNIHLLIRDSVQIDGVWFVGSTLWTDMRHGCPITQFELQGKMNDFRLITYFDPIRNTYSKYRPRNWLAEHVKDLTYLKREVERLKDEQVVVITHHAPSTASRDDRYLDDYYGQYGYCNNLEDFILDNPQIKIWCHGHVHQKQDYLIGSTNVVCNPHGYVITGEYTGFYDKEVYQI